MIKKYNLQRFIDAHSMNFDNALREIANGKKITHWMWYVFPQIKGLGKSYIANYYAIESLDEAKAYLNNEMLRENTLKILNVLMELKTTNATEIFGKPDDLKLRSSLTLFSLADPSEKLFQEVLGKYYNGIPDKKTEDILNKMDRLI